MYLSLQKIVEIGFFKTLHVFMKNYEIYTGNEGHLRSSKVKLGCRGLCEVIYHTFVVHVVHISYIQNVPYFCD